MTSRAALEIILQARDEASRVVTGAADSFGTLSKSVGQVAQDLRPVGEHSIFMTLSIKEKNLLYF